MLFFVFPVFWAAIWGVASIFICAAMGITPQHPHVWLYFAGVFVAGGIAIPAVVLTSVYVVIKRRYNARQRGTS